MPMDLERLTVADQRTNDAVYRDWVNKYHIEDGWTQQTKKFNFESFARIQGVTGVSFGGASVLDVGCGTGDFFPFLDSQNVRECLGIDVLSQSIERAREKHPRGVFRQGDFLVEPEGEKFDYVFCSGALSVAIPSGNYEYMRRILERMWEVTHVGFAFNYLTHAFSHDSENDFVFLYSRNSVAKICHELFPEGDFFVDRARIGGAIQDTVFIAKAQ